MWLWCVIERVIHKRKGRRKKKKALKNCHEIICVIVGALECVGFKCQIRARATDMAHWHTLASETSSSSSPTWRGGTGVEQMSDINSPTDDQHQLFLDENCPGQARSFSGRQALVVVEVLFFRQSNALSHCRECPNPTPLPLRPSFYSDDLQKYPSRLTNRVLRVSRAALKRCGVRLTGVLVTGFIMCTLTFIPVHLHSNWSKELAQQRMPMHCSANGLLKTDQGPVFSGLPHSQIPPLSVSLSALICNHNFL